MINKFIIDVLEGTTLIERLYGDDLERLRELAEDQVADICRKDPDTTYSLQIFKTEFVEETFHVTLAARASHVEAT